METQSNHTFQPLVLLDFYADWCGPCQTMQPVIEGVKEKFGDKVEILKIDADRNPRIVANYRVSSIPAYVLLKNKKVIWRRSGLLSKSELEALLLPYF
ncbi:MAG TPA: thioredoxin family protein [Chitinophagales bacterium]|nr:thioredoxin family protein [Chitinophagales bacterium]